MTILFSVTVIILCLCTQAFFTVTEMSTISSNRIKISHLAYKKDKRAARIEAFLKTPERFLAVTLIGTNLAIITASSFASGIASRFIENPYASAVISTAVILPLILIFGEITPKTVARKYSTQIALGVAPWIGVAFKLLYPLAIVATRIAEFFSRLVAGTRKGEGSPFVTREELKLLIKESVKHGIMDEQVLHMAHEIFDFGNTAVKTVMVPLKDIVAVPDTAMVADAVVEIARSGYSRIPVSDHRRPGDFLGFVQSSDIICEKPESAVAGLLRRAYVVKEWQAIEDVLKVMRQERQQFAFAENEYGRVTGIVTMEDIIEEITGEIEDEYSPKGK